MSLINVASSGGGLVKSGGCAGCPDARAVSEQQITGNGGLEFIAPGSQPLVVVGLGSGGIGTGAGDINFAVRLQNGTAEVRELGAYKSEVPFRPGDMFRIGVAAGVVQYLKNDSVFYTSGSQSAYAMRVHAVLFDTNAAVANVIFAGVGGSSTPPASAPAPEEVDAEQPMRYAIPRVRPLRKYN